MGIFSWFSRQGRSSEIVLEELQLKAARFLEAARFLNLALDNVDKDDSTAVVAFKNAAELGSTQAQYNLGVCYATGKGVERDDEIALGWYYKAANNGDAWSQYTLGVWYQAGRSIEKDVSEAFRWFKKSAEQGHWRAIETLATAYTLGLGVPENKIEARMWLEVLANGEGEAEASLLRELDRKMTKAEIAKSKHLAQDWLQKHNRK